MFQCNNRTTWKDAGAATHFLLDDRNTVKWEGRGCHNESQLFPSRRRKEFLQRKKARVHATLETCLERRNIRTPSFALWEVKRDDASRTEHTTAPTIISLDETPIWANTAYYARGVFLLYFMVCVRALSSIIAAAPWPPFGLNKVSRKWNVVQLF